ncbi:hypothetical protein MVEN_00419400 [Mycena venus]|uniref:DUF6593 domain-containing protein n=1 Tax=Mycena venus TaxID=2733690 RepID=A0A8H6YVI5_9AGAR|nr:hypothetical protein MVEN_00419400 [Mycena venus]
MNPFSQGWSNTTNNSRNAGQSASYGQGPSVYGALPYPTPTPTPNVIGFTFVTSSGSVLNSIVNGPQSQTYFRVTTDTTSAGFSVVQNSRLETITIIEWRKHPVVEICGIVSKRSSSQFLALSPDKTHRLMNVRGRNYRWMPDAHYIGLYSVSAVNPQFFGRISQTRDGTEFEVTAEALQLGLLEIFVVSAVLLMCGRNID